MSRSAIIPSDSDSEGDARDSVSTSHQVMRRPADKGDVDLDAVDFLDNRDASEAEQDVRSRPRRTKKPTDKQRASEVDSLAAEKRKVAALNKRIAQMEASMAQSKKKQQATESNQNDDDGVESEDETLPLSTYISSSIEILPVSTHAVSTSKENRTPLARAGAAARKSTVPRVSSNSFRNLPAVAIPDEGTDDWELSPLRPVTNSDRRPANRPDPQSTGPALVVSSAEKRPRPNSEPDPLPTDTPPRKKTKGLTPNYREGAEIKPKKPKAADYEDVVQALILRAASEYECLISTQNAFPDTSTRNKWARKAWKSACAAAGEHYELTDRINGLLRKRGSRIRGHAVTEVRKLIANAFGFKWGTDAKTKAFNRDLVTKLINPATFHYKEWETQSGYMQGKVISDALHSVWFEDKTSQGVIFEHLFNPIPFETLALLMTVIDFCINEWSTGVRIKMSFWEKGAVEKHQAFRTDLGHWENLNAVAIQGIRKKYYARASRCAGVTKEAAVQPNLVGEAADRARDELEGRTGETDSEDESQEADE